MNKNKLYVCRPLLNASDIIQWVKKQGLKTCLHESEYHVTIAYSKTPVDVNNWSPIEKDYINRKKNREIKKFGNAIVLGFESNFLTKRWKEFIDGGCSWDHEEYQPHVTITYEGEDINPKDIEPYQGDLVFGHEEFSNLSEDIEIQHISLDESVFRLSAENQDNLFDKFRETYEKSTGISWTRDKFISRAKYWEFYGNDEGFISLRPQKSGIYKLVGMAGSPQGILEGISELQATNVPVWGAVSQTLARVAKRRGLLVPSEMPGGPMILKMIFKIIPSSVFGGVNPSIEKDGSVVIDYPDFGSTKKYFVCNKEYLMKIAKMPEFIEKIESISGAKMFFKMVGVTI